jgi:uncharacterized protein
VITNCHVHTFTSAHTPDRFLPWPADVLIRFKFVRTLLSWAAQVFDRQRTSRLGRYAQIIETSYGQTQEYIFGLVRDYYPPGTRFVVLPMDMTQMNAGSVDESIDVQHEKLAELRDANSEIIVPFAAVDPRHPDIVTKTIELLEQRGFRGIKLYPPTGYHPFDTRLHPLYAYANEHGIPVLTHCSSPADVKYRGDPTPDMLRDPEHGDAPLTYGTDELLKYFTRPDTYLPLLNAYPNIRVCLAHFGGAGDWGKFLEHQGAKPDVENWLIRIRELLQGDQYPNVWTDIAYTLFADDEYVYLLKLLLNDDKIRARVLFGSDFYVVRNADLEERRRSVRIRAVLGEDVWRTIAEDNPREFLGF